MYIAKIIVGCLVAGVAVAAFIVPIALAVVGLNKLFGVQ